MHLLSLGADGPLVGHLEAAEAALANVNLLRGAVADVTGVRPHSHFTTAFQLLDGLELGVGGGDGSAEEKGGDGGGVELHVCCW